jgi:hypothetical protein
MAASDSDLVDLPSDADEEETLRYAISLSLREHEKATGKNVESKSSDENKSGSKQPPKTSFGSIMLDRKAMEQERLRRQAAKRPRAAEEDDEVVEVPAPKKKTASTPSRASTAAAQLEPRRTNDFPNGAVKRTWAQGYPRTADDIKIEEVFQKERLELALISSFQWDEEWMLSKLNTRKTRLLLVAYAADEAQVCCQPYINVRITTEHHTLTWRIERSHEGKCSAQHSILLSADEGYGGHAFQTSAVEVPRLVTHCSANGQPHTVRLGGIRRSRECDSTRLDGLTAADL